MSKARANTSKRKTSTPAYQGFEYIDGSHPLKSVVPEMAVEYQARKRKGGKVVFFNFKLAKEMGIIPETHANEMNPKLESKILDTFAFTIINEYDVMNDVQIDPKDILPNKYMATRYLQLQHPNKQGKTSGDGRSVWNGMFPGKEGTLWDISSCGIGATKLSPATAIHNKYFKTGDESFSYGCGYSEVDEGFSTLFFSEVLSQNNVATERVLGIIEFEKGLAINIRAHQCLIRPSHLFRYIKLDDYENLKNLVDYYIDRQVETGQWSGVPSGKKRYDYFLERQAEAFAKMAARMEDDYIFCWLDWDGDNVLMDGSLLDYGSIRQFGLFHHEYRYDDVERFSTTIVEQKEKARYTVQTFAQIADFLKTKNKKSLQEFKNHRGVKTFNKSFEKNKTYNLLKKIGFPKNTIEKMMSKHQPLFDEFQSVFSYFERAKSHEGVIQVADGINWSAIFCMRDILRELPQIFLSNNCELLNTEHFIEIIKSSYAKEQDLEINSYRKKRVREFQNLYLKLIDHGAKLEEVDRDNLLLQVTMRSSIINKYDRITGDSITYIVQKVMKARKKMAPGDIDDLLTQFVRHQNWTPEKASSERLDSSQLEESRLLRSMLKIVQECREGL